MWRPRSNHRQTPGIACAVISAEIDKATRSRIASGVYHKHDIQASIPFLSASWADPLDKGAGERSSGQLSALACATLLDDEAGGGITDNAVDEIFWDGIKNAGVPIAGNVNSAAVRNNDFRGFLPLIQPGLAPGWKELP
jgi:hypothetical protein